MSSSKGVVTFVFAAVVCGFLYGGRNDRMGGIYHRKIVGADSGNGKAGDEMAV